MRVPFSTLLLAVLLTGCATGGDFPSLAPRPVEQLSMEEPVRIDPAVAPDPAFRARVAELLGRARAGDAAFEAAFARAAPAARDAGTAQSESWVVAQQAISRAEAARIGTTTALADLDELASERADVPTNGGDHQALMEALRAAASLADDQYRRLAALRRSVSR